MFTIGRLLLVSYFLLFFSLSFSAVAGQGDKIGYFDDFIKAVKSDFENLKTGNAKNNESVYETEIIDPIEPIVITSNDINFYDILSKKYLDFALKKYDKEDYVDAFFFKQKAAKVRKYHTFDAINPIFFGILPEDLDAFLESRRAITDLSVNRIIQSHEAAALIADTYFSYDCWLESTEEGYDLQSIKRCKKRFIDNIRSLELFAFSNNIKTNRHSFKFADKCHSCELVKSGKFCNAIYFFDKATNVADGVGLIIRKIESKIVTLDNPTITIYYYDQANLAITNDRLRIIYNILQNQILVKLYNKPLINIEKIKDDNKSSPKFQNAFTVCIIDNNHKLND